MTKKKTIINYKELAKKEALRLRKLILDEVREHRFKIALEMVNKAFPTDPYGYGGLLLDEIHEREYIAGNPVCLSRENKIKWNLLCDEFDRICKPYKIHSFDIYDNEKIKRRIHKAAQGDNWKKKKIEISAVVYKAVKHIRIEGDKITRDQEELSEKFQGFIDKWKYN